MKYTLGGERVGSGKKMQGEMHHYYRSTFNLSEKWASSAGVGILYPSMVKLAMRGDSFSINVDQDARTIPTLGPLFGSFKMQTDIYQVPVRLYQAILHNNPLAIGLNMQQVKFPTLEVKTRVTNGGDGKLNNSCLLKYLGLSGLGTTSGTDYIMRKINAVPALAYYDIFKTYYANKQEENAYVISKNQIEKHLRNADGSNYWLLPQGYIVNSVNVESAYYKISDGEDVNLKYNDTRTFRIYFNDPENARQVLENLDLNTYGVETIYVVNIDNNSIEYTLRNLIEETRESTSTVISDINHTFYTYAKLITTEREGKEFTYIEGVVTHISSTDAIVNLETNSMNFSYTSDTELGIQSFKLSNIDDMRYTLLSQHELGVSYKINNFIKLPYTTLFDTDSDNNSYNKSPLNGLVLKTYQNDIYNNWLNTEWIEGENGINELTQIAVVDGKFSMDSFIFATKLFNMLNRIAVAGATYEDWQDVVYEEVKRRQIESPIFIASISNEIVFDEIVQTSPADGQPLGELGGRGRASEKSKSGGHAVVKCDEASFIIAITSLTPRQFYTQGNEFYLTDVFSIDDVHKPPMDGIGFQDLIGERLAWFDTIVDDEGTISHRSKIGKLPAWIEYMTSIDRAYGDFAETDGKGYMILNRNYEQAANGGIKDATTYIDPSKYNYVFAYSALSAQNFWLEINFNIKARRLMSARLIPNV